MIDVISNRLRRFHEDKSGAAMVEFAISIPILLLVIAIIIEGTRMTWTHQAAASGVRDAARFFARTTASDICEPANATAKAQFDADADGSNQAVAQQIVTRRLSGPDDVVPTDALLPGSTAATTFAPQIDCMTVTGIASPVPVVSVSVSISIDFPFGGVFALAPQGERLDQLTVIIGDESRVYGS